MHNVHAAAILCVCCESTNSGVCYLLFIRTAHVISPPHSLFQLSFNPFHTRFPCSCAELMKASNPKCPHVILWLCICSSVHINSIYITGGCLPAPRPKRLSPWRLTSLLAPPLPPLLNRMVSRQQHQCQLPQPNPIPVLMWEWRLGMKMQSKGLPMISIICLVLWCASVRKWQHKRVSPCNNCGPKVKEVLMADP